MYEKNESDEFNYKKIKKFLKSDANEIEFFHYEDIDGDLITLEEYLDGYYEETKKFLEKIKPEISSIRKKNYLILLGKIVVVN